MLFKTLREPADPFFPTGLMAWVVGGLFVSLLGCKVSLYLLKHIGLKKYEKIHRFFV